MGYIPNKFAYSKCRTCGKRNAIGESVYFVHGVKGVQCVQCADRTPEASRTPTEAPTAPTSTYAPGWTPTGKLELPKDTGDGGRHVVREWGSFRDYVECAKTTRPVPGEPCWASTKESFYGTTYFAEAIDLADKGWDAVRPQVDALVEKIDDKVAPSLQPAFTSYFDVSGGAVDIGRFLDGEPECMVETRLVEIAKPGRVITLLINGSFMALVGKDEIIERGCAIVALVDCLEKMQHQVEIWIEKSCAKERDVTPKTHNVLTHLIRVKDAGQELDINELMFAVAHPACHRRLTFALRRNEPSKSRFGIPEESTCPVTCKDRVGATLVLESLSYEGRDITAEEWIMNALSEVGLVIEGRE